MMKFGKPISLRGTPTAKDCDHVEEAYWKAPEEDKIDILADCYLLAWGIFDKASDETEKNSWAIDIGRRISTLLNKLRNDGEIDDQLISQFYSEMRKRGVTDEFISRTRSGRRFKINWKIIGWSTVAFLGGWLLGRSRR